MDPMPTDNGVLAAAFRSISFLAILITKGKFEVHGFAQRMARKYDGMWSLCRNGPPEANINFPDVKHIVRVRHTP
jgi:hypothetical protein